MMHAIVYVMIMMNTIKTRNPRIYAIVAAIIRKVMEVSDHLQNGSCLDHEMIDGCGAIM